MDFLDKVYISISKPSAYGSFLKESLGKSIWYGIKISLFASIIAAAIISIRMNSDMDRYINKVEELPNFSFVNGTVSFEAQMPFVAYDKNDLFISVDTRMKDAQSLINSLEKHKDAALLTDNKLFYKEGSDMRIFDLTQYKWLEIDKEKVMSRVPIIKFSGILGLSFMLISAFVIKQMLFLVLLSFTGFVLFKIARKSTSFTDCAKLTCYSITLPVILSAIVLCLGRSIVFQGYGGMIFLIGLYYLWRSEKSGSNVDHLDL